MITETPYAKAVLKLYEEIALSIKGHPIKTCITGGGCVHFLTGTRVSSDVEGFFSSPVLLPPELIVEYTDNKKSKMVYYDHNYSDTLGLMHPDAMNDSLFVLSIGDLEIYTLSPVDLIVSKIIRLSDQDGEDIKDVAIEYGINEHDVRTRALEALSLYAGNDSLALSHIDYISSSLSTMPSENISIDNLCYNIKL